MRLPFTATGREPFTKHQFDGWVIVHKPDTIELTDREYAHLAALMHYNPTEYRSIPIVFIDAPTGGIIHT